MNNDYKQVYKNSGTVARTTDQAYKNAEYATPIYRHVNHDLQDALNFFGNMIVGFIYMSLAVAVAVGILMFFGIVVIN